MKSMIRHEVKIEYYLYPTEEWVEFMKSHDGTRHWAGYYETHELPNGDTVLECGDGEITQKELVYDTETLLRGLKLYALSHSERETEQLLCMETDSHERSYVWQLGFFGEVWYS